MLNNNNLIKVAQDAYEEATHAKYKSSVTRFQKKLVEIFKTDFGVTSELLELPYYKGEADNELDKASVLYLQLDPSGMEGDWLVLSRYWHTEGEEDVAVNERGHRIAIRDLVSLGEAVDAISAGRTRKVVREKKDTPKIEIKSLEYRIVELENTVDKITRMIDWRQKPHD